MAYKKDTEELIYQLYSPKIIGNILISNGLIKASDYFTAYFFSALCEEYIKTYNNSNKDYFIGFLNGLKFETDYIYKNNGWFNAEMKELDEIYGIKRRRQEMARNKLKELGFIEEKIEGRPPKVFYKINFKEYKKFEVNAKKEREKVNKNRKEIEYAL